MKLLFADDERSLQEVMRIELADMGHTVTVCPDGITALAALQHDTFDCLLVDLDMPGASGLEVIAAAKELHPEIDAVIMTGKSSLESVIDALRQGVADYLRKPCRLAEIEVVLQKIAERRNLKNRCAAITKELQRTQGTQSLIGSSAAMQRVQTLINKLAPTEATVVILGETGTGKELVARALHERSRRREQPFVAVNCGALPEALIESELFGHRKGSFTGADEHRTGLLQVASGGTLFLDEIGELPKAVQAKLLRFLEAGEVRKVGENTATICDVRVVCATLQNLETMVRDGTFREDLWFRINTFEIHLPPLRERLEDLDELLVYLVARYRGKIPAHASDIFSAECLEIFRHYHFPGNVRQLANIVEHALILTEKMPIEPSVLPPMVKPLLKTLANSQLNSRDENVLNYVSASTISLAPTTFAPTTLRDLEAAAIEKSLARCGGNKSQAAAELGISIKTLYNKLNSSEERKSA